MLKKTILTLCFVLVFAVAVGAREGTHTLYGAVSCDGEPVVGAHVTVTGESSFTARALVTDGRGIYMAGKLPTDEYLIQIVGPELGEFLPAERNVFLHQDRKEVNFLLKRR